MLCAWSGWATDDQTGVRTWGPAGWETLAAWCDRLSPELAAAGVEMWLRPHACHVLSDAQRCLTFVRSRGPGPIGLLLDPLSMLTESMMPDAPDHLVRIFDALAAAAGVRGLWLPPVREDGAVRGSVSAALVGSLVRAHWPGDRPIVLGGPQGQGQTLVLGELSLPSEPRSDG